MALTISEHKQILTNHNKILLHISYLWIKKEKSHEIESKVNEAKALERKKTTVKQN